MGYSEMRGRAKVSSHNIPYAKYWERSHERAADRCIMAGFGVANCGIVPRGGAWAAASSGRPARGGVSWSWAWGDGVNGDTCGATRCQGRSDGGALRMGAARPGSFLSLLLPSFPFFTTHLLYSTRLSSFHIHLSTPHNSILLSRILHILSFPISAPSYSALHPPTLPTPHFFSSVFLSIPSRTVTQNRGKRFRVIRFLIALLHRLWLRCSLSRCFVVSGYVISLFRCICRLSASWLSA